MIQESLVGCPGRHRGTVTTAQVLAIVLTLVHLAAGDGRASGPYMATAPGSSAACGTQPAVCTPYPGEDIFTTHPTPPPLVLSGSYWGLAAGDVLNSISTGYESWFFFPDARIYFSVSPGAVGIPGIAPDVASEATTGQAVADVFDGGTFAAPAPNTLLVDGDGFPAAMPPALGLPEATDDLSGLTSCNPFTIGCFPGEYFTLAPGSPTLAALGATPADILRGMSGCGPSPVVVRSHLDLGLDPADVIDAISLYWGIDDQILYSLAPGSPTLTALSLQPGDILRYAGTPGPVLAVSGTALGLAAGDNLDALDVVPDADQDLASDQSFVCDNCVGVRTTDQTNSDNDSTGDACDPCTDTDGDGKGNPGFPANTCPLDNCPTTYNPSQIDGDGDGAGDACDQCPGADDTVGADADGDGVMDVCDTCPGFDDGDPTTACGKLFTLEGVPFGVAFPSKLHIVNPFSLRTLYTVAVTLAGNTVTAGRGLAADPLTGTLYALLRLNGQSGYDLVSVDPVTGAATHIGATGDRFGAISFGADGTLYAVSEDTTDGVSTESLFILDATTGAPSFVLALGNGDNGEAIAFRSANGRIFHASGLGSPIFESIDPQMLTVTNIPLSGTANTVVALVDWPEQNSFLASTLLGEHASRITPSGAITTLEARFDHPVKGFAFRRTCGNGVVGAGEECDDGNAVGGDCCSATCAYEGAGSTCSGGACDGAGTCVPAPGASKCLAKKLKAIAKRQRGKLGCRATAATHGDPSGVAACDAKVDSKFAKAFAKVASGCAGAQAGCAAIADDCVANIAAVLSDAGPSTCEGGKLKAVGKKVKGELACYARAAAKATPVDDSPGGCLDRATLKFFAAFAKAESAGPCTGSEGNVAAVANAECVGDVVATDASGMLLGICP